MCVWGGESAGELCFKQLARLRRRVTDRHSTRPSRKFNSPNEAIRTDRSGGQRLRDAGKLAGEGLDPRGARSACRPATGGFDLLMLERCCSLVRIPSSICYCTLPPFPANKVGRFLCSSPSLSRRRCLGAVSLCPRSSFIQYLRSMVAFCCPGGFFLKPSVRNSLYPSSSPKAPGSFVSRPEPPARRS